jgi:hypothetical protein
MGPVVAPAGTTAVAPVGVAFVGTTRLEVLKRTPVGAVVKLPLMVTVEPTMPLEGEKVGTPGQVASGPVEYVKGDEEPSALITTTFAGLLAPAVFGISTSSWVPESMCSPVPLLPPKVTFDTFGDWKFVPVIVTSQLREAALGVTDATVGTAA